MKRFNARMDRLESQAQPVKYPLVAWEADNGLYKINHDELITEADLNERIKQAENDNRQVIKVVWK